MWAACRPGEERQSNHGGDEVRRDEVGVGLRAVEKGAKKRKQGLATLRSGIESARNVGRRKE
eukprot:3315661-Pleurochrysis_carterae.AAC.2